MGFFGQFRCFESEKYKITCLHHVHELTQQTIPKHNKQELSIVTSDIFTNCAPGNTDFCRKFRYRCRSQQLHNSTYAAASLIKAPRHFRRKRKKSEWMNKERSYLAVFFNKQTLPLRLCNLYPSKQLVWQYSALQLRLWDCWRYILTLVVLYLTRTIIISVCFFSRECGKFPVELKCG